MTEINSSAPNAGPRNCRVAFKEWGAICESLAQGRQILILRKGGIHEGREGFRVAHDEFWLYPTRFHESVTQLVPEGDKFAMLARARMPSEGQIRMSHLARVTDVVRIMDLNLLERLAGQHIWSPQTLIDRFRYREPGLFALIVRVFRRSEPLEFPESPRMAGCRSWVQLDLDTPLSVLEPVIPDEEFAQCRGALRALLGVSDDE